MYIVIILKTIFLYLFIMVGFRIMGKKEVGQLNVIDLIVSILIAELAALSLETAEQSLLKFIVPITTLILIQISLSYWSLKDSKVRTILEGRPTVIIKDGKLNFSAMAKIRYSLDDLILQLREKGYQSIEEVSFVPATLLPKGWTWKRYYDGSGCLLSPEQKEFMIYDLETNEYKFDKDSDYDFFPLSYYYGDGVDPKDFKPFEYMEEEILTKYLKLESPFENQRVLERINPYKELINNLFEDFSYDELGFYLGIISEENDLSPKEIDSLIDCCYSCNSAFINPMYLAEQLTKAIYKDNYITMEDLKKMDYKVLDKIIQEDNFELLKNYSSNNYEIN